MRKIIHIDMDAFFASIEQRDNPAYQGKPLAVGYSGNRGVVAAASYEARQYGVRSAMSSKIALRKCPHLIFTHSRFDVYKSVSKQIMDIFLEYTDEVEPLSLDEAFLDITHNHKNILSARQIAKEIKDKIFQETQLTASAGISFNKFLAKIASDINKPDGLFVITPKRAEEFIEKLPIERFFGVGKVTAEKMHQMGIKTGYDLKQKTEQQLISAFGKTGSHYYLNARGIDERAVEPNRERKSVGAENTFLSDIDNFEDLDIELEEIAQDVINRIQKAKFEGRTVTLKVRYADFTTISRSRTLNLPIDSYKQLLQIGKELIKNIDITQKVRLLGISLKNNTEHTPQEAIQLSLEFEEYEDD